MKLVKRERRLRGISAHGRLSSCDFSAAVACNKLHGRAVSRLCRKLDAERGILDRRINAIGAYILARHELKPHGLPYTRGASVGAGVRIILEALLADRLSERARIILGVESDGIHALAHERGNIIGKRGIAAEVSACEAIVDPELRLIVDRSEVYQHSSRKLSRAQLKLAVVPKSRYKIGISNARKSALGAKGHVYLLRALFFEVLCQMQLSLATALAKVKYHIPLAVQIPPSLAQHLRTRIFGAHYLLTHNFTSKKDIFGSIISKNPPRFKYFLTIL